MKTPLGVKPDKELFEEQPFNLAGEALREEIDAEGEARIRTLAESEARKAQLTMFDQREHAKNTVRVCRKAMYNADALRWIRDRGVYREADKRIQRGFAKAYAQ